MVIIQSVDLVRIPGIPASSDCSVDRDESHEYEQKSYEWENESVLSQKSLK